MKKQVMKFLRDEDGLTMVEYAIAGGLITLGAVVAFGTRHKNEQVIVWLQTLLPKSTRSPVLFQAQVVDIYCLYKLVSICKGILHKDPSWKIKLGQRSSCPMFLKGDEVSFGHLS